MTKFAKFATLLFGPRPTSLSRREAPGRVAELRGIIFQCDTSSALGGIFIRPAESLDLWFAGLRRHEKNRAHPASLGMHAGLHVTLEDGRNFVVEQLAGGWREWLVNGLHWTPLEAFRQREKPENGGWDVTVKAGEFRQVDEFAERYAVTHLNSIRGRAFLHEDCTGFIGRVFGSQRRIFADSPILRSLGYDFRSGEPALPLLRREAVLDPQAEERLQGVVLRDLPDPAAESASLSLRQLHHRMVIAGVACAVIAAVASVALSARRGGPLA